MPTGCRADARPVGPVGQEADALGGEGFRVLRRHEGAAVAGSPDELDDAADIGAHGGLAAHHRLDEGQRQPFGDGGQGDDVAGEERRA